MLEAILSLAVLASVYAVAWAYDTIKNDRV